MIALRKLSFIWVVALTLGFVFVAQAQNRERFGISAKAGGVNAVTGRVMVKRAGQTEQLLTNRDDLASGDVVNTSAGGQAEILLNPGTYLRLAENTEFVLVDNSLDNLQVKLNSGSVIVEATGVDGLELHIPIVTAQQRMTIVRAGIYRINVTSGLTELFVHKGRMRLGDNPKHIVKGGKKATFTGGTETVAKLEKTDKDDFDEWSKLRGKTLARANAKLSARTVNGYLASGFSGWNFRGRYGLWTWSPFASCYTFLPFYYGWGSPYGSYYGSFAGGYYGPGGYRDYRSPVIVNNSSGNGSVVNGSGSSPAPSVGGSYGPAGGGMGSSGAPRVGSQAGPRDPDSGGRAINRIKDPN
jgi:hypothetical protein